MAMTNVPHVTDVEIRERAAAAASLQGIRVAWGGVWCGFLVAVGIFMLLSVLGLAIGISSADIGPGDDSNAAPGMGAAIWSGATLLIALFVGGMAATRAGMVYDRAAGMVEGVLIWVLSVLALIYMAGSGVGMLTSSVFGALGGVTRGAAAVVSSIDVTELTRGDADQIATRLTAPTTVQIVAAATGVAQTEARATLSGIAERVQSARNDPAQAAAEARQGLQELAAQAATRAERAAAQAQPYASATLWTTLAAMVLALLAAIFGAMTGRRKAARRLAEVSTTTEQVVRR